MEEQAADLVLTYTVTVGEGGIMIGGNPEIQAALRQGYRILDVITTTCGTAEYSFVCVTVVLTLKSSLNVPYKSFIKQMPAS